MPPEGYLSMYRKIIPVMIVLTLASMACSFSFPSPKVPTPEPSPASTPFGIKFGLYVMLFDDANGDALRQATEAGIAGGVVRVTNISGSYSNTKNTVSAIDPNTQEPLRTCFDDVPEGTFNISVAVPEGYTPTTGMSYQLKVNAGDRASVDFGAQSK
jgi:hypothetical protein